MVSTCRLGTEEDAATLAALSSSKSRQLGRSFWLPKLSDPRTYRVFVFETDGVVTGALIFRTVWEMILAADSPQAVATAFDYEAQIRMVLDRGMVDQMIAFVPKDMLPEGKKKKPAMQRVMERLKMRRIDGEFACYEGEAYGTR